MTFGSRSDDPIDPLSIDGDELALTVVPPGTGVDIAISQPTRLYGNTYRYSLIDGGANDDIDMFDPTLATLRSGRSLVYVPIDSKLRLGKSKIKLVKDGIRFFIIILKIATFYSPLKIFLPISSMMFLVGFGYGLFKVLALNTAYGPTSAMLMTMSLVVFLVGLVSEQVAQMRLDRSEIFDYDSDEFPSS